MHTDIHAHVPYPQLASHLEYAIAHRINPEVYLSADALDTMVWEELAAQAAVIHEAGLTTSIHAPFMDLYSGALDASIREATRRRMRQTLQAAEILKPRAVVVHPGFDELHYGEHRLAWMKNSIAFWGEFVGIAAGINTVLAAENIFDREPSTLKALIESVDSPCFRHCFDIGHFNLFATVDLEEWFRELGDVMVECHIHDNHGVWDEHLPVGEGTIDFDRFFGLVQVHAPGAVRTIEAHSTDHLQRALRNVRGYLRT
jgi:sugar phosphate isomerase/epimerase